MPGLFSSSAVVGLGSGRLGRIALVRRFGGRRGGCRASSNRLGLGGAVQVGEAALVGAGSTVLRNLRVGAGATLGAGAVLLQDLPDGEAWAGVPARALAQASA